VKTRMVLAGVLVAAGMVQAQAQQPVVSDRVAQGMPSRYIPPDCGLKAGHFKVSSGATYLKTGIETGVPANKTRALASGQKVLTEAINQNNQEKNPAAWYYLGRIYLQQGDLVGADSAFTKAEALSPQCKQEISKARYMGWVPLVNAGIDFTKAQNTDSALALFRQANVIYRDKPLAYLNGGIIFANAGQTDSAIAYWQKASEIGEQNNIVEDRNIATRNWGAALQRANRHKEAIPVLEKYITWVPNDSEVKRALATSYRAAGDTEKAQALEKEVGGPPAGPASAAAGSASQLNAAITLYNQKNYKEAAPAFEQLVATEPYNRDALYGLANSYIGLNNGPKLAETAARLAAIEPMNQEIIRMLATGQRKAKKEVLANKTAVQALSLPITVTVTRFAPTADGATITGTATGREAQTAQGKPIAAKPVTLIFEFLDNKGAVVANQEVQVPALKPDESQPIEAKGQGAGIAAWRYKRM
jgi:tetratricopeptide (TPR) repeat protein